MSSLEEYLKFHICSECHAGILALHPQYDLRDQGFIKCPICGFTKKTEVKSYERRTENN